MSEQEPEQNPERRPGQTNEYRYAHAPGNVPAGPRHALPEDLALYSMKLLSSEESGVIAEHLDQCADCRREFAYTQGDLAIFAFSIDMQAPQAATRERLLKQVAREKKVISIASSEIASFGRSADVVSIDDARPKRHVGRVILGGLGWAIAAGLAFTTATLYKDRDSLRGTLSSQSTQIARLSADAAQAHQLMDVLTDPKAVRVSLSAKPAPKPAPSAGATYNAQKGTLIFLASDLNPLQLYKTYELWVLPADGSAPVPAGTFHPDDKGSASLIMPDLPKGIAAKGFGVTIEDEGGSQKPTMPIVLSGLLDRPGSTQKSADPS